MKYEHQINWATVYNTNLDDNVVGQTQNGSNDLISTRTSSLPEQMENSEVCTLYDHKISTTETSCMMLAVYYALLLSVSFKPIFVDLAFVIDMLALLQFSLPWSCD